MKRMVVLVAIVLVGAALAAGAQPQRAAQQAANAPQFPPIGAIEKVRDNLYLVRGQGGNTAVFVTRAGVVLVDTKLAGNGPAILDQVKKVSRRPVTTIINTHVHADHVGSNGFFPASVEVVAHANTRPRTPTMAELTNAPGYTPDRTYKERMTIGGGADRVELYHFGAGHTNGDTLVVFPAVRTMHSGDLFAWKSVPFIDTGNGGSGVALPATIEKAAKEITGVDSVITGHMAAVQSWADFVEYGEFNREFLKAVEAAHHARKTAQQAAAELTLPAKFAIYIGDAVLPGLEFLGPGRSRVAGNVEVIYRELDNR